MHVRTQSIAPACTVAARVELRRGAWDRASFQARDVFEEALGAARDGAGIDEVEPDFADAARGSRWAEAWVVLARTEAQVAAFAAELRRRVGTVPNINFTMSATVPLARVALARPATGVGKVKFQSGCPARFGLVELTLRPIASPAPAGAHPHAIACAYAPAEEIFPAPEFDDASRASWIAGMFDGIAHAAKLAAVAGLPSEGIEATITGGAYHLVDSCESAFELAAGLAFTAAVRGRCQ